MKQKLRKGERTMEVMKSQKKGFTLIGVLIIIVIGAVVAPQVPTIVKEIKKDEIQEIQEIKVIDNNNESKSEDKDVDNTTEQLNLNIEISKQIDNTDAIAGVQSDFREFSVAAQAIAYEQGGFTSLADEDAVIKALNANLDVVNQIGADGIMTAQDPWSNVYTYKYKADADDNVSTKDRGSITFTSYGPDGQENTADDLSVTVEYTAEGTVKTTTNGFEID